MAERMIPAPVQTVESAPFYEAAAQGRFLLRRCTQCRRFHWYPRPICPFCHGGTEWVEGSGEGSIFSYSVMRRSKTPYAIAYVELAEGPLMLTNLVDCDFDRLEIGQTVRLHFKKADDGTSIPCFTPAKAPGAD